MQINGGMTGSVFGKYSEHVNQNTASMSTTVDTAVTILTAILCTDTKVTLLH